VKQNKGKLYRKNIYYYIDTVYPADMYRQRKRGSRQSSSRQRERR
jgi:hypothetical protein